jgi:hypothetical protein
LNTLQRRKHAIGLADLRTAAEDEALGMVGQQTEEEQAKVKDGAKPLKKAVRHKKWRMISKWASAAKQRMSHRVLTSPASQSRSQSRSQSHKPQPASHSIPQQAATLGVLKRPEIRKVPAHSVNQKMLEASEQMIHRAQGQVKHMLEEASTTTKKMLDAAHREAEHLAKASHRVQAKEQHKIRKAEEESVLDATASSSAQRQRDTEVVAALSSHIDAKWAAGRRTSHQKGSVGRVRRNSAIIQSPRVELLGAAKGSEPRAPGAFHSQSNHKSLQNKVSGMILSAVDKAMRGDFEVDAIGSEPTLLSQTQSLQPAGMYQAAPGRHLLSHRGQREELRDVILSRIVRDATQHVLSHGVKALRTSTSTSTKAQPHKVSLRGEKRESAPAPDEELLEIDEKTLMPNSEEVDRIIQETTHKLFANVPAVPPSGSVDEARREDAAVSAPVPPTDKAEPEGNEELVLTSMAQEGTSNRGIWHQAGMSTKLCVAADDACMVFPCAVRIGDTVTLGEAETTLTAASRRMLSSKTSAFASEIAPLTVRGKGLKHLNDTDTATESDGDATQQDGEHLVHSVRRKLDKWKKTLTSKNKLNQPEPAADTADSTLVQSSVQIHFEGTEPWDTTGLSGGSQEAASPEIALLAKTPDHDLGRLSKKLTSEIAEARRLAVVKLAQMMPKQEGTSFGASEGLLLHKMLLDPDGATQREAYQGLMDVRDRLSPSARHGVMRYAKAIATMPGRASGLQVQPVLSEVNPLQLLKASSQFWYSSQRKSTESQSEELLQLTHTIARAKKSNVAWATMIALKPQQMPRASEEAVGSLLLPLFAASDLNCKLSAHSQTQRAVDGIVVKANCKFQQ